MATTIGFTKKSWDKARPKEKDAKFGAKFATALANVEKAEAAANKNGDPSAYDAHREALEAANDAATQLMKKECDAKKDADLVKALKKFNADCKTAIKKCEDAKAKGGDADDDEGDVPDDELFGLKLFKECIKKAKLKSSTEDGVSFCLGVHKDALQCKLVFMKKKKFASQTFKQVYKVAKSNPDLGLKRPKMTYGAAYRDPESKETLVLHIVEGAPTEIPGMVRKLEKWRKKFKQDLLPFKELSIRTPSGQPLENTPDPDEEEAGQEAPEAGAADTATTAEAPAAAPAAEAAPAETTGEDPVEDRRKEFKKARRAWQTVKEQAIQDLEAVKDGIRDYYLDDPEQFKIATGKLNQLDAIFDNLGDELRDKLDEYVSTPRNRQGDLDRLGGEAAEIVQQFLSYASRDPLLNAVDQKEFADVTVKAPIETALKDLVRTLA